MFSANARIASSSSSSLVLLFSPSILFRRRRPIKGFSSLSGLPTHMSECCRLPSLHAPLLASTSGLATSSGGNAEGDGQGIPSGSTISSSSSPIDSSSQQPSARSTLQANKNRLFKLARAVRRAQSYDEDKIDEARAMAEFNLSREDLRGLRLVSLPKLASAELSKSTHHVQRPPLYYVSEVHNRALQVHGSDKALYASKHRPLVGMGAKLTEAERMRMRMRVEAWSSATTRGGDRVVGIALLCNCIDTVCKFAAAYYTGSKSLFAEGVHSTMDTFNQVVLYLGIRYSRRVADPTFPYGYSNMRYVSSLISGCGIAAFGCGLSVYHGVSGLLRLIQHPAAEMEPLTYAFIALGLSLCFQSFSLYNAVREIRLKSQQSNISMFDYVRSSGDPSLNVVLLEDTAAVAGVAIAFTAVSLSAYFNTPVFDCCGSIAIGALLGTVAAQIIRANATHLVGRSLPKRITDDIVNRLLNDPVVRSVHDVKATSLGVEKSRFKAEIDFNGSAITKAYIRENCDLNAMLKEVREIKTEEELEKFMCTHGEKAIDRIGDEVDRLEKNIVKRHPDVHHVDLESM